MMIQLESRVAADGTLTLAVPLALANKSVRVSVEPVEEPPTEDSLRDRDPAAWRKFVDETAGSILDPTFMRHDQGELEERGELFP